MGIIFDPILRKFRKKDETSVGTIFGSGTSGYIPKWTGASSQGNSPFFTDGTSVGLGTATPTSTLDIVGSINSSVGYWQGAVKIISITSSNLNNIVWAGLFPTIGIGTRNTFIGSNDAGMATVTSGSYNFIGGNFGTIGLTTGSDNVVIGAGGETPSTGSKNIAFASQFNDPTLSYQIGFNARCLNANEVVFGNKDIAVYNSFVFGLGQYSKSSYGTGQSVNFRVTTRQASDAEVDSDPIISMWRLNASQGTGTIVGGDFAIAVAPAGSTGSTPNALVDAFTVKGSGSIFMPLAKIGNVGVVSGELYFDTAANALANGDKICIRKT